MIHGIRGLCDQWHTISRAIVGDRRCHATHQWDHRLIVAAKVAALALAAITLIASSCFVIFASCELLKGKSAIAAGTGMGLACGLMYGGIIVTPVVAFQGLFGEGLPPVNCGDDFSSRSFLRVPPRSRDLRVCLEYIFWHTMNASGLGMGIGLMGGLCRHFHWLGFSAVQAIGVA